MILAQYVGLLILGLAAASTGALSFLVYFNNPRSATNRTYLGFSLISIVWGALNYASTQVESPTLSLWMWRLVIFVAVWFCFGIFHLATIFPDKKPTYTRWYLLGIIPAVAAVSGLTLTSLVFASLHPGAINSKIPGIQNGPLIAVFGATIILLVAGALWKFLTHMRSARGDERNQYLLITAGTAVTFVLLIACNFILPAIFGIFTFIPFGSVFILPFIMCTGYAIAKYRMFNARMVVTEIFAFLLVIMTLLQVAFSVSYTELLLRMSVFVLVLIFDILLLKRTANEINQRDIIEKQEKELEKTNELLRELDKQKSEFLSFASHQLRTPLTAIKWSAGAMLDRTFGELPETLKEPIATIFDESTLMALFINDYLNVSRIEQGSMEYRFIPTDVAEVLRSSVSQLESGIKTKKLTIRLNTGDERVMVWADGSKLTQVFTNLIDNALKYTPAGGIDITLSKKSDKGVACIEIKDTGIGMDAETLLKVFDKFVRGENAKQVNTSGSGLGLFIVKTFVKVHKGTIKIDSEGIGKGTTFILEFPLLIQTNTMSQTTPKSRA